ncbi:hypothetical protein AOC36_11460 [Erysipelothrix larvae]|uniref:Aminotransferase n=1 Tax=Erysipelothrix larvae TaxID=1514105 RepID=A0A0X8H210_9FIRM|nr:aminotransferase class I/II-fold pyridoxal phosphate-dependent enzyme [Erysipelothrix larvae]AMC94566.1 hypothetical protein AOC36_11460 [Erysipelothrix larvae]
MAKTMNKLIESATVIGVKDLTGYVQEKPEYVKLTIGEPNFNTDDSIKKAAIQALLDNDTHYPPAQGYEHIRKAIADYENEKHGTHYTAENILITQGSTEGLACILNSILNPGDEVVVPMPYYPIYRTIIEMCGAKLVEVDTSDTDFMVDPKRLNEVINENTKAVMFTTPNNPTGTVYTKEAINALSEVLKEKDVFIILDEIYSKILYTEYHSFAQVEALRDKVIVVQSFSKIYAMTGWRLGYVATTPKLITAFMKWHHNVMTGVTSFIQHAIIPALKLDVTDIVEEYKARRDYTYQRLVDMGFDVALPDGAFYIFPSIEKFNMGSKEFCIRAAQEGGVMLVPGKPFGDDKHVRISFCYNMETIEKGLDLLEKFVKNLG